jgi:hypothetical protein
MKVQPKTDVQKHACKMYNNFDALATYAPAIYLQLVHQTSKNDKNFKVNFIKAVKKAPHAALEYCKSQDLFTHKLEVYCKRLTAAV